jgi:hypothetical protein
MNIESFMVCMDCFLFCEFAELHDTDERRERQVDKALTRLSTRGKPSGYLTAGEERDEFSWRPCECCDSTLGGERHELLRVEP